MWEKTQAVWWVPFPGSETKSLELVQGGFFVVVFCFVWFGCLFDKSSLCSPRLVSNSQSSCLSFRRAMEEQ